MLVILLFISTLLFASFLHIKAMDRFQDEMLSINESDYPLKRLLPLGFVLLELINYKYNTIYDERLREKCAELYGSKNAELHLRLNAANKLCAVLLSLLIILFLGSIVWLQDYSEIKASNAKSSIENNSLIRPEFGEGDKALELNASISVDNTAETVRYRVVVNELAPSDDNEAVKKASDLLNEALIKGKNKSLGSVALPLKLESTYESMKYLGITIEWTSQNQELVNSNGAIADARFRSPDRDQSNLSTYITAAIKKNDAIMRKNFYVTLDTADERSSIIAKAKQEIDKYIKSISKSSDNNKKLELPTSVAASEDVRIEWTVPEEKLSTWDSIGLNIIVFALVVIILIWLYYDKDINSRIEKRRRKIQYEFPAFVTKLLLLVNAGVNISGAIVKTAENKQDSPLYWELNKTISEIKGGMPELQAYEMFAQRCKLPEVTKFVSLVIQNIRKGNSEIVQLLKIQSRECWEIRKNNAKRLGEEASTKLLLPLALMLIGILIIVSTPAILAI